MEVISKVIRVKETVRDQIQGVQRALPNTSRVGKARIIFEVKRRKKIFDMEQQSRPFHIMFVLHL